MEVNIMDEAKEKMTINVKMKGMGQFKVRLKIIVSLLWVIKWISPCPMIVNKEV